MDESRTGYERVHRIWDYVDQPRTGVANYHGEQHWFDCIFDESRDDYSSVYWLTPLGQEVYDLERQCSEIFDRWCEAFDKGIVNLSTHPALPPEAETFKRLHAELQRALANEGHRRFKAHGTFRLSGAPRKPQSRSDFEVMWSDRIT